MGVVVESPELAREILRVIDISKRQNSYRLRLAAASGNIEWLTGEEGQEVVLNSEPETDYLHRLYIRLIAPFIPESLL